MQSSALLCRMLQGRREQMLMKKVDGLGDYMLGDLQHCTVKLQGSLSALRMHHLESCRIVAGPIQGAAFLDGEQACLGVPPRSKFLLIGTICHKESVCQAS